MTEIVKAGGALAIRPDQTAWTEQQGAVLRQSGIDNQVTTEELSAFLHLCQRTRLDPFSRQIYLIGRWDNRQNRKVYTPQTSIDGYRVIAHRASAEAGHPLGYDDTVWCDASGRWRDVWLSDEPPAAAKVSVIRNGQRFSAVARYAEYVQTNKQGNPQGLWGKMPATMTAKCAEALALRMAFPHDLAGVYTAEEMGQADNAPAAAAQPQAAAPSRDYLAEARAAGSAEAVRKIYREAAADGYGPGTAMLQELAAIGKEKAAVEEVTDAAGESGWAQEAAAAAPEDVVDVEIVDEAPVADEPPAKAEGMATSPQMKKIFALFNDLTFKPDREKRLMAVSLLVGRPVPTMNDLTSAEASELVETLSDFAQHGDGGPQLFKDCLNKLHAEQAPPVAEDLAA